MQKRVLIIAYAFWPMNVVGAIRPLQLASGLLRKGYDPVVLTTHPWDESITDREFGKETVTHMSVKRTSASRVVGFIRRARQAIISGFGRLMRKRSDSKTLSRIVHLQVRIIGTILTSAESILDALLWTAGILHQGRRISRTEPFDCIFCTAPPYSSLVASALLSKLTRTPLVADFRDLWSLHEYHESFNNKKRSVIIRKSENILERWALSCCTKVIYNTLTAKTLMDVKHPTCADKSFAITNGIISWNFAQTNGSTRNDRLHIAHTGGLYGDRDPADFFDGLKRWIDKKGDGFKDKVVVDFVGRGATRILEHAQRHGLAGVVLAHEHKPRAELKRTLEEADMFLLCLGYRKASGYVIPAKIFDYLGAGKPIIAFAPTKGEVFNLMQKLNLGDNVVTKRDPDQICRILDREYERLVTGKDTFTIPSEIKEEYDYSSVSDRIEHVIGLAIDGNR